MRRQCPICGRRLREWQYICSRECAEEAKELGLDLEPEVMSYLPQSATVGWRPQYIPQEAE